MHPDLLHKLAQQRSRDLEQEIKRIHLSRALGGRRQNVVSWLSRSIRKFLSSIQRPKMRKPEHTIKGAQQKRCSILN